MRKGRAEKDREKGREGREMRNGGTARTRRTGRNRRDGEHGGTWRKGITGRERGAQGRTWKKRGNSEKILEREKLEKRQKTVHTG